MSEGFSNAVIGGAETIARTGMKSANYVPGTSGWRVAKVGDAEFNNATVRGTLLISNASGSYIKEYTVGAAAEIDIQPPTSGLSAGDTYNPATIQGVASDPSKVQSYLEIASPWGKRTTPSQVTDRVFLRMSSGNIDASVLSDFLAIAKHAEIQADLITLGSFNGASIQHISGAGFPSGELGILSPGQAIGATQTSVTSAVITLTKTYTNQPFIIPMLSNTSAAAMQWIARPINITPLGGTYTFQILFMGPAPGGTGFTATPRYLALDIL